MIKKFFFSCISFLTLIAFVPKLDSNAILEKKIENFPDAIMSIEIYNSSYSIYKEKTQETQYIRSRITKSTELGNIIITCYTELFKNFLERFLEKYPEYKEYLLEIQKDVRIGNWTEETTALFSFIKELSLPTYTKVCDTLGLSFKK